MFLFKATAIRTRVGIASRGYLDSTQIKKSISDVKSEQQLQP